MDDVYELEFKVTKGMGNHYLDIKIKGGRVCNLTIDSSAYRKYTLEMAIARVARLGLNEIVNWCVCFVPWFTISSYPWVVQPDGTRLGLDPKKLLSTIGLEPTSLPKKATIIFTSSKVWTLKIDLTTVENSRTCCACHLCFFCNPTCLCSTN